ncbi:CopL family metal-binding regulatory protein [Agrilutibacter solisilvae]|uniref:CopL family metal-binding regulatory protein n=1 Tax=Agrilutibacter solisilvae TaxID=2763317 RepID=A0A974XWI6_9GAMM|nr:CopL family metal-binding regulatory protein [Lysobacter solisilvae]QSX77174.1 CopL family metal-binding regulatory protein [Lysobacter solisilvae]
MSVGSLLLRVVLSLALILNGAATAIAHAHPVAGGSGAVRIDAPESADASMDMPCHGQAGHELALPKPAGEDDADQGCCESSACQCACVHPVHATLVGFAFAAPARIHAPWVQPFAPGYPEPAQPHLIRPPIG